MIKSLILLACTTLFSITSFAQFGYDVSKDAENGMIVYQGEFSFDDLKKEPEFNWLEKGSSAYKLDTASVAYLKKHLGKFNLIVLMGTWCDDSHNMVPKLYKTLQASSYPMNQYKMYGVNRAKETKGVEHKIYQVYKVPTIIVFRNQNEVGRIVENVQKSVETDLAGIIEKVIAEEEKKK